MITLLLPREICLTDFVEKGEILVLIELVDNGKNMSLSRVMTDKSINSHSKFSVQVMFSLCAEVAPAGTMTQQNMKMQANNIQIGRFVFIKYISSYHC